MKSSGPGLVLFVGAEVEVLLVVAWRTVFPVDEGAAAEEPAIIGCAESENTTAANIRMANEMRNARVLGVNLCLHRLANCLEQFLCCLLLPSRLISYNLNR